LFKNHLSDLSVCALATFTATFADVFIPWMKMELRHICNIPLKKRLPAGYRGFSKKHLKIIHRYMVHFLFSLSLTYCTQFIVINNINILSHDFINGWWSYIRVYSAYIYLKREVRDFVKQTPPVWFVCLIWRLVFLNDVFFSFC